MVRGYSLFLQIPQHSSFRGGGGGGGGLFPLKQCISSSLKHDTVPRVNYFYYFYVKSPPKRIALWDGGKSEWRLTSFSPELSGFSSVNLLFLFSFFRLVFTSCIGGLQSISRDTGNNAAMYNYWSAKKRS